MLYLSCIVSNSLSRAVRNIVRFTSTRITAFFGLLAFLVTGCLGLDLDPAVGLLQSVVAEGEALPENIRAAGGNNSMTVSGQIVGRLRCDTIDGKVKQSGDEVRVTITVISGRQGCNSTQPTTLSYIANILNIKRGLRSVVVRYRYEGVDGVSGVRLDTLVTIG